MLPDLLHGDERKVWGDGGYQGQTEVIREAAPAAQDMTCRRVKNHKGEANEEVKKRNRTKSRVRAKVEWAFRILKRVFKYTKVRYRGLVKKSALAPGGLRAGQCVSASQAVVEDAARAGTSGGVVSLGAGNRPS